MSVQEKMSILKDTVDGWRKMSDLRFEITNILKTNLESLEKLKVELPEGVVTSEEDDLVNSIMGYHEIISRLNDLFQLHLSKLLVDVHQLADKIDPDQVFDF